MYLILLIYLRFEFWYRTGGWKKNIKSLKASVRICWLALSENAFSVIKTAAGNNPETPTDWETPTETDGE